MNSSKSKKLLTYGIYSILFLFFVGIWMWEFRQFDEVLLNMFEWEKRYELPNVLYALKATNLFSASIISLSLGVGLFIKNRIGWIMVTGWFYYVCSNLIRLTPDDLPKNTTEFFHIVFLLSIPVCFIVLMNKFAGILEYHRVKLRNKIKLNLLAIGMGILLLALLSAKKKMLHHFL